MNREIGGWNRESTELGSRKIGNQGPVTCYTGNQEALGKGQLEDDAVLPSREGFHLSGKLS